MKILAVDIGTGTQDILLVDPALDLENAYKLILPAPTMIVRARIQAATRRASPIALHGVMMGGGPGTWAAEDHLRAGYLVYATPDAARTFNDDLAAVASSGVHLISEDELAALPPTVERIELKDFDFPAIRRAFLEFGLDLDQGSLDAVAVAVFDHGAAPAHISDRQFRFDYLDACLQSSNHLRQIHPLSRFAYHAGSIPVSMTRLTAVAASARALPAPLLVMDTAPAAVLGALQDPDVRSLANSGSLVVCNIGNFHTIAFRLAPGGGSIEGMFEHHTGLLDRPKLEAYLASLAQATLTRADVFADMGHGALVYTPSTVQLTGRLVVTGPRRTLLAGSSLEPFYAVPFGDMMVSGCFGLLAALGDHFPTLTEELSLAFQRSGRDSRAPWDSPS
jgi:uncharacterized protein (DUF1786 family)